MTLIEEPPAGPPPPPDPPPAAAAGPAGATGGPAGGGPPPLRRGPTRLVAGVCTGIADRFEVDVTVVRVAFVVAACLWGVGVVVYLALWALLPGPDDHAGAAGAGPEASGGPAGSERSGPPWATYLLLTGALFLGLVISATWWGRPGWGGGLGLAWLVVLFVAVVVALRRPSVRLTLGRLLLAGALVVISLLILVTAAFAGAVALTGVPVTGGTGQRVVQPVLATQLAVPVRMAAGDLTVDLTRVPLGPAPRTVRASVAVGQLTVEVPPGAVVDVEARTGIGTVDYGPAGPSAFAVPVTVFGPARPQLVVDAQVGIGRIRLVRGPS